ncbi:MAG: hypothetical protein IPM58_12885 [Nitrospira sp.]|nr:hypothetical protein [Nitrospira sp.]
MGQVVLIAETDAHTRDRLPRILSSHFPNVTLDRCASVDELTSKLRQWSYHSVAISPPLIPTYRLFKQKQQQQLLVPLLVTAGQDDHQEAYRALVDDAFDLIVKPLVPHEAVRSVRLALWQNKLLRLLASKERASERFRQHMAAFPHAVKAEEEYRTKLDAYDRTLNALQASLRLLLNEEDEQSLFDTAASVEFFTRQRALARLVNMNLGGTTS